MYPRVIIVTFINRLLQNSENNSFDFRFRRSVFVSLSE